MTTNETIVSTIKADKDNRVVDIKNYNNEEKNKDKETKIRFFWSK